MKFNRVRYAWLKLNTTSRKILTKTYAICRVQYASATYLPRLCPSIRKKLEDKFRMLIKSVYKASQVTSTKYVNALMNHIPLGIHAFKRRVKIHQKLSRNYETELSEFNQVMEDDYYAKLINNFIPSLKDEIISITNIEQVRRRNNR